MAESTVNFTFKLEAFERRGNLWLKWSSDTPWRAQQGQIHVYNGNQFPNNPQDDTREWRWDDIEGREWDTGLNFGDGWHCAWIAEKWNPAPDPLYRYLAQTITEDT